MVGRCAGGAPALSSCVAGWLGVPSPLRLLLVLLMVRRMATSISGMGELMLRLWRDRKPAPFSSSPEDALRCTRS